MKIIKYYLFILFITMNSCSVNEIYVKNDNEVIEITIDISNIYKGANEKLVIFKRVCKEQGVLYNIQDFENSGTLIVKMKIVGFEKANAFTNALIANKVITSKEFDFRAVDFGNTMKLNADLNSDTGFPTGTKITIENEADMLDIVADARYENWKLTKLSSHKIRLEKKFDPDDVNEDDNKDYEDEWLAIEYSYLISSKAQIKKPLNQPKADKVSKEEVSTSIVTSDTNKFVNPVHPEYTPHKDDDKDEVVKAEPIKTDTSSPKTEERDWSFWTIFICTVLGGIASAITIKQVMKKKSE